VPSTPINHYPKTTPTTMRVLQLLLLATPVVVTVAQEQCRVLENAVKPPHVTATTWLPTSIAIQDMDTFSVQSTFAINETASHCDANTHQPIFEFQSVEIGTMPIFKSSDAMQVLDVAVQAWDGGKGIWTTQYTTQQRIDAIRQVFIELQSKRDEIVQVLQWEIGKNRPDAESEFDRTIQFGEQLIDHILSHPEYTGEWNDIVGTPYSALTKRTAVGIILMLAPYNYPINECYAMLLPALLTGNVGIVKIPTVGGLAHLLTMEAFAKVLPPGTVNFISGPGPKVLPGIMKTGKIDVLALVGSAKSADALIRQHPDPHRLKVFLQLGAKNIGLLLPDLFLPTNAAVLNNALTESILGALSFNGQRCTALKIFFVPKKNAKTFVSKLTRRIEAMTIGLPWQNHTKADGTVQYSQLTPLPNFSRIHFLKTGIDDAVDKGAKIVNANGGTRIGGSTSTLMVPAVLYPIQPGMKFYTEEQFGPVIPIAVYDDLEEVLKYAETSEFAQQISVFGQDVTSVATIVDRLGSVVSKINLNSQCGRSPDTLAFSARRSSGMGVMSVSGILREFSIPTVIAHKSKEINEQLTVGLQQSSIFLGASTVTASK
jgi:glyceraldehyde-3-phosphate dehydrogenase (NADP+)